jgi:hypothetical protein
MLKQDFSFKDTIGAILVPVIIILIGSFFFKNNKDKINKNGTYVIAKKIKWEFDEASNGVTLFEFYINGEKKVEKGDGCDDSKVEGKYFVIQYYEGAGLSKIDYLCSDSISYLKIKRLDLKANWKEKPVDLIYDQ